ncbi:MAG: CvpA family protein [Candidatus Cryptobacteroides sp.]
MSIIDIILLICFIPAIINGIRKGFIAQVVAIVSLILGAWLSYRFSSIVSKWIAGWIEASPQILEIIAYIVIFIVVVMALFAVGKVLESTIKIIMLGWLNRLLGCIFAIVKCALIVGLVVLAFDALNTTFKFVDTSILDKSVLYSPIRSFAANVFPYIKSLITK